METPILVLEPDQRVAEVLADALRGPGYIPLMVTSREELLALAKIIHVPIVVLHLPEPVEGQPYWEPWGTLLQGLKEYPYHDPRCIAIVESARIAQHADYTQQFTTVVRTPVKLEELLEAVANNLPEQSA